MAAVVNLSLCMCTKKKMDYRFPLVIHSLRTAIVIVLVVAVIANAVLVSAQNETFSPTMDVTEDVDGAPDPQCSAYLACVSLGNEGLCCPTSDGVILKCCEGITGNETEVPMEAPPLPDSPQCDANPTCATLSYTGACCPTQDGLVLDCCGGEVLETCEENPQCVYIGLTGACCPTPNGKFLDCCEVVPSECALEKWENYECGYDSRKYLAEITGNVVTPSPTETTTTAFQKSDCEANPTCVIANLTGSCCPMKDGTILDCCEGEIVAENCRENPKCLAFGLTGSCCPSANGKYLDCCEVIPTQCSTLEKWENHECFYDSRQTPPTDDNQRLKATGIGVGGGVIVAVAAMLIRAFLIYKKLSLQQQQQQPATPLTATPLDRLPQNRTIEVIDVLVDDNQSADFPVASSLASKEQKMRLSNNQNPEDPPGERDVQMLPTYKDQVRSNHSSW